MAVPREFIPDFRLQYLSRRYGFQYICLFSNEKTLKQRDLKQICMHGVRVLTWDSRSSLTYGDSYGPVENYRGPHRWEDVFSFFLFLFHKTINIFCFYFFKTKNELLCSHTSIIQLWCVLYYKCTQENSSINKVELKRKPATTLSQHYMESISVCMYVCMRCDVWGVMYVCMYEVWCMYVCISRAIAVAVVAANIFAGLRVGFFVEKFLVLLHTVVIRIPYVCMWVCMYAWKWVWMYVW